MRLRAGMVVPKREGYWVITLLISPHSNRGAALGPVHEPRCWQVSLKSLYRPPVKSGTLTCIRATCRVDSTTRSMRQLLRLFAAECTRRKSCEVLSTQKQPRTWMFGSHTTPIRAYAPTMASSKSPPWGCVACEPTASVSADNTWRLGQEARLSAEQLARILNIDDSLEIRGDTRNGEWSNGRFSGGSSYLLDKRRGVTGRNL